MAIKLVANHQNSLTSLKDTFINHTHKIKADFFNNCHIVVLDINPTFCRNSFPNIWECLHKVRFSIHKTLLTVHISIPTLPTKLSNQFNKLFSKNYPH